MKTRVPEGIELDFLYKGELEVGKKYYGYGERDGFKFAEWDGKYFEVPRLKFGMLTTILYDHFQDDDGAACFFPIEAEETIIKGL